MQDKGDDQTSNGRTAWLEALKRVFRSLQNRPGVMVREERDRMPDGFGWQETEDEYQQAQSEWLEQVARQKDGSSGKGSREP